MDAKRETTIDDWGRVRDTLVRGTEKDDVARPSSTDVWRGLISDILARGNEVRQEGRGHEPRSRTTRELIGHRTVWDMRRPLVLCPQRKIGRRFSAAEPAWILRGDNRVSSIAPYASYFRQLSDDGVRMSGAYGPRFVDQLPYILGCLRKDPTSRQAVVSLWRERPGPSADVACTLSLQWLIRNGALCCIASMRSSDAWLGVPYDVVSFSCMSAVVAINMRLDGVVDRLGDLVLTAGSQHLYAIDREAARACSESALRPEDHAPLDLAEFEDEQALADHLQAVADREPTTKRWLGELVTPWPGERA